MDDTLDQIKDKLLEIRKNEIPYLWIDYDKIKDIVDDLYNFCLKKEFDIYRLYEGKAIYKCEECNKWQEYPDFDVIEPNDDCGHFDCEFCGERNIRDYDDMKNYIRNDERRHVNYKPKSSVYIFNNEYSYGIFWSGTSQPKYTLSHNEIYEFETELDNPSNLLHNDQMLVDILFWDSDSLEIFDIMECWRYIPLSVYHGLTKHNK